MSKELLLQFRRSLNKKGSPFIKLLGVLASKDLFSFASANGTNLCVAEISGVKNWRVAPLLGENQKELSKKGEGSGLPYFKKEGALSGLAFKEGPHISLMKGRNEEWGGVSFFSSEKVLGQRNLRKEYIMHNTQFLPSACGISSSQRVALPSDSAALFTSSPLIIKKGASFAESLPLRYNSRSKWNSYAEQIRNQKAFTLLDFDSTGTSGNKKRGYEYSRKQTLVSTGLIQEEESKKVFVIINSFGGSVGNGITVHDALQFIKAGSLTLGLGVAASAASLVLAGGTISERYVTEGCHVMIHQPECVTPDHNVLTDKGFISIAEVTLKHKVAVLNKKFELEYQHPLKVHKYDYQGNLYFVKNQEIDLQVTPTHRMFINTIVPTALLDQITDTPLQFNHFEAQNIVGQEVRYKKDGLWRAPDYQFILPLIKKDVVGAHPYPIDERGIEVSTRILNMDDWLYFFGMWTAEGCTLERMNEEHHEYTVQITQKNTLLTKKLEQCFANLGYIANRSGKQYRISNKQLWTYLKPLSVEASNKFLPDWVWELSQSQCLRLIEGLLDGDGYVDISSETEHFFTGSEKLALDFCRLCVHAGSSASYLMQAEPERLKNHEISGQLRIGKNPLWRVNILSCQYPFINQKPNITDGWMTYSGPVHCLTVPYGTFYVQRNGLSVWTGNSGLNGQASDIWIDSQEIRKIRLDVAEIYSLSAHRPRHKILRDLDRDFYLTATETIHYGLADEIATNDVLHSIIEETNKVWNFHDSKQQSLLEKRVQQQDPMQTQTSL